MRPGVVRRATPKLRPQVADSPQIREADDQALGREFLIEGPCGAQVAPARFESDQHRPPRIGQSGNQQPGGNPDAQRGFHLNSLDLRTCGFRATRHYRAGLSPRFIYA